MEGQTMENTIVLAIALLVLYYVFYASYVESYSLRLRAFSGLMTGISCAFGGMCMAKLFLMYLNKYIEMSNYGIKFLLLTIAFCILIANVTEELYWESNPKKIKG